MQCWSGLILSTHPCVWLVYIASNTEWRLHACVVFMLRLCIIPLPADESWLSTWIFFCSQLLFLWLLFCSTLQLNVFLLLCFSAAVMTQTVQTNGVQPLSKTWELSLYELQRTPQVPTAVSATVLEVNLNYSSDQNNYLLRYRNQLTLMCAFKL